MANSNAREERPLSDEAVRLVRRDDKICLALSRGFPSAVTIDRLEGGAPTGVPCEKPLPNASYPVTLAENIIAVPYSGNLVMIISNAKIVAIDAPAICWYNGDLLFQDQDLMDEGFDYSILLKLGAAFFAGRVSK